jgi:hypothetical protein
MRNQRPTLFQPSSSFEFADVLAAMERKKYLIRSRDDFDLNVVCIRRAPILVNQFNDVLFAFYPLSGQWQYEKFQVTTLPGYTFLADRLLNKAGTAILVPDQYVDKYCVREHDDSYQALCQKQDVHVKVWRDDTLDGFPNPDKSKTFNARGINIHRAEPEGCTVTVDSYSAGCQVFRCIAQFDAFMVVVRRSRDIWGNSFTYTLLDEEDL